MLTISSRALRLVVAARDTSGKKRSFNMRDTSTTSKLELSPLQLIASALAAASAAVTASYFGVNGTVIGAAVASVVATVGSAVYSHSIQRTYNGVRRVRTADAPRLSPSAPRAPRRPIRWSALAGAAALVFGGAIVAVTAGELVAHRPLASVVTGRPDGASTSIGSIAEGATSPAKQPAHPTPAASPSPVRPSPTSSSIAPSPSGSPTTASPTTAPATSPTPAAVPTSAATPSPG